VYIENVIGSKLRLLVIYFVILSTESAQTIALDIYTLKILNIVIPVPVMRKLVLISVILLISIVGKSQSLSVLADSCYYYMDKGDMISFNNIYIKLYEAAENEMDHDMYVIRKELNQMRMKDQGIRILLMDAMKRYKQDDNRIAKIREMMGVIDSTNAARITEIIDDYGWMGSEDIGEDGNETLFLCIQHINDSIIQNKYLPILKQAVSQGNAKGWHYAFLTDRVLMNQGKPQIYGTQTINSNQRIYLVPLQFPERVDELRKDVGLDTLKDYLKNNFGYDWTLDNYLRELPETEKAYKSWHSHR